MKREDNDDHQDEQLIYEKFVQTEEEEENNETTPIPQIEFNCIDNLPLDIILSPLEEESDDKNEKSSFGKFSYTKEENHNDTGNNKIEDTTNNLNDTHGNNEIVNQIMNSELNEEIITNSSSNSSNDSTTQGIDGHSQNLTEKQKEQKDNHITETSESHTNEYESEGESDFQEDDEITEETYDDISDENISEEEIIEILADNATNTLENNSTKEGNIEVTESEKEMIEEFERKINKLNNKL